VIPTRRETTPQHFAAEALKAVTVLDVIQLVLRAQRLVERDEICPERIEASRA